MRKRVAELVAKVADGKVIDDYEPRSTPGVGSTAAVRVGSLDRVIFLILTAMHDGVLNADELEDLELDSLGGRPGRGDRTHPILRPGGIYLKINAENG